MTLVYPQGDFEAFLTAVLETWVHRAPEWDIAAENGDWFTVNGAQKTVRADSAAAHRVARGLQERAGEEAWLAVGQAFRHSGRSKEALLSGFIRACVRHGPTTLEHLTDHDVRETLARARAVRAEVHRYLGLIRFQAVEGEGLYGRFEPDHDVLGLLVGSFRERLTGHDWVLHDVGRRKAWVCRSGVGEAVTGIVVPPGWRRDPGELDVQRLWYQYFRTIAIQERLNPGLQRSKMPLKTWKHLVEKGKIGAS